MAPAVPVERPRPGQQCRSRSRRRATPKDVPHFTWQEGMRLGPGDRYVVQRLLGDGTFGRVLLCSDEVAGEEVAIKVIKDDKHMRGQAKAEAEVLRELSNRARQSRRWLVQLHETFIHCQRHMCLVLEALGGNLSSFLKANKNLGLYLEDVKAIFKQLLECVAFLHAVSVIHTDLKTKNVLLRRADVITLPHPRVVDAQAFRLVSPEIVVIDFGSAVFEEESHVGIVCTRQFRPPEVVLGMLWDKQVDLWSAGCIAASLYQGQRPFNVHEDMEHLAMMEQFVGARLPLQMCTMLMQSGLPEGAAVNAEGALDWLGPAASEAKARVQQLVPLRKMVEARHKVFSRMLEHLFALDPQRRMCAGSALKEPFFAESLPAE
mmetsp:Transcript_18672/g.41662  ORF Transcript_18672/g.41662 Transcript_18672/m.41662 type:complete len:376 (+) Transcript_18672:43-1170(+)